MLGFLRITWIIGLIVVLDFIAIIKVIQRYINEFNLTFGIKLKLIFGIKLKLIFGIKLGFEILLKLKLL